MPTTDVVDGAGVPREFKVSGAGSPGDPFIAHTIADEVIAGTGATSLGKAEDAPHASGDTGVMALAKRGDTPAATSGADGRYEPLQLKDGQLWARVKDGSDETLGAQVDTAASADTGTFSLIALFKRLLARMTTLIGLLPTALGSGGGFKVDGSGTALPVSGTVGVSGTVTVDSELTTADLDTGAGTDTRGVVGLVIAESGGAQLVGSAHPMPVDIGSASVTIGSSVTANQGTPNSAGNSWPVEVTDGTNVLGTSTHALRTDPTGATAQPVTDNGGNLSIDDGGNLISVDDGGGNLSIDDGGNLISIDDGAGSITVDGSVTVSGTVTANAGTGTFTVDSELPAAGALSDALSNPTAPAVGAWLVAWDGAQGARVRVASKGYDMSAVSITSIATVATPAGGKKLRLMSGTFSVSAACSVLFEDNASGTTVFRTPELLADTPYSFDLGGGYLLSTADHVLKGTASTGTVTITGTLRGVEE